ncbi:MAG: hypothetical protein ACRDK7_03560 [Solirubrobacteraceae bacterium]
MTQLPATPERPLAKEGASDAPYGFVFQLIQKPDDSQRDARLDGHTRPVGSLSAGGGD